MSTISDVARVAGVSEATVSRALRGLDRVSPQTRQRVLRVAEDLHYVASPTATSLASGRTRVVAVVVMHRGHGQQDLAASAVPGQIGTPPGLRVGTRHMPKERRQARLDPEFAEKFLTFVVAEVVRHHEALDRRVNGR